MTDTQDMAALTSRLCQHYGAVDLAALMETPEFQAKYAEQHARAPTVSTKSLMGKALIAMQTVQKTGVTVQAHCIEPNYEHIIYEKAEKEGEKGGFVTDAIGILIATPDGDQKFVKFADFDPLTPIEDQFRASGIPPSLQRAGPLTLSGVDTFTDLLDGTTRITITKETVIQPGGHNLPFPEGPDLERVIGATAANKRQGAWKVDKKYGTLTGRFGDTKGDPRPAVVTVTSDKNLIQVRNFDEDPPEKHHIAAQCFDRRNNGVGIKFKLADALEQFGLSASTTREAIQAKLAGQRVLVRGQGSLFMPKSPEDFGTVEVKTAAGTTTVSAFEHAIDGPDGLRANGYLIGYGDKGNVRLSLKDKYILDENQQRVPQLCVRIGDRDVYDIVQKGVDEKTGKPKWEISVLAVDEQKLPWMSCYGKTFEFEARDGSGTKSDWYNRNAFVLFLDGVGTGAELRADDPYLALVDKLPVPSFVKALEAKQTSLLTNGPAPGANGAAAPMAAKVAVAGR
jgi:hypothetical protein